MIWYLRGSLKFQTEEGPTMAGTTVYDVLAWGFLAFNLLFTLVLLRLWWEENRDVARIKAARKISN